MLSILLLSFVLGTIGTLCAIRWGRREGHASGDHDFSGPQKFHRRAVPRIGGVGIFIAFVSGLWLLAVKMPGDASTFSLLVLCTLPVFVAGLTEDFTKNVSPRRRLFATAVSAAMGAVLIGAAITRTDIPGLDFIAATTAGAVLLAVFAASGVANSFNIIDGMNGIASMCAVLMFAALAYIAAQTDDMLVCGIALAAIGAVLGFFVWNYPNGLIFLGDGGAYFIGFVFAEASLLLLHRNPDVSPLCPLLLCAYPVMETVFSMYRRKVVRGQSVGAPDGIHLHSLVYRRLVRWAIGSEDAAVLARRNSMVAPYLWLLCLAAVVPAVFWWGDSAMLSLFLLGFATLYVSLYSRIVKFRTPRLLVRRREPRRLGISRGLRRIRSKRV